MRLAVVAVLNAGWSVTATLSFESAFPFGMSSTNSPRRPRSLLTPVFYHALYREIGAVRDGHGPWTPSRRLWVEAGALLSAVSIAVFLNPLTHYVAAAYFVRRSRSGPPAGVGPPVG